MASTDAQKNDLRAQLEGYRTKMLLLQQEISLICDKTDHIELLRAQELEDASKARHHLEIKLQKYRAYVKQLERERDDLRDSVLELVAKVESNPNALNLWPRSHMEMKSFLDPITRFDEKKVSVDTPELLSYAATRITSLTQQRDLERQNFNQTQRLFEAQVRTLQAQVARRDAILATCREHASHHIIEAEPNSDTRIRDIGTTRPMSDEQLIKTLRKTVENNQILETEVRILGQKLEQARISYTYSVSAEPKMTGKEPPHNETNVIPDPLRYVPNSVLPPELLQTESGSPKPKNSDPYTITHPSYPRNVHSTLLNNDGVGFNAADVLDRPHLHQIDALDHQISTLSSKIDTFKEERNLLKEILALQQSASSPNRTLGNLSSTPHPVAVTKHIPGPLQHTSLQLRNEPQGSWETRLVQDQDSCEKSTETWPTPSVNAHQPDAGWAGVANNGAQLPEKPENDDENGELSMELTTPLTPANIVLPDGVSRSSRAQSPIDSNEESPRMIRPRILPSPLPTSIPSSPTRYSQSPSPSSSPVIVKAESDLVKIQQELMETRRQLQERNQELADLHAVLQTMREKGDEK